MRPTPQSPLAQDKVRFVGEPIALVVADNRYLAEDAAERIEVVYRALPLAGTAGDSTDAIFADIPDNTVYSEQREYGDAAAAFAGAATVVSRTLRYTRQTACPMETRGCIADFDPATGHLTFYSSTQAPHRLQRDLASVLGLPEHLVTVVMHDIGGAFGQKIPTQMEDVAVAVASMRLGRPVRWIEDRVENLVAAPQARGTTVHAELALSADRKFLGIRATIVGDSGAYSSNYTSCLTESYRTARAMPGPYDIANYSYDLAIRLTNTPPIGAYRGVGFVTAQTIRELLIDEAARVLKCDPYDLRAINLIRADQLPYTTCTGWVFNEGSFAESMARAKELLGDAADQGDRGAATSVLRGVGISPFVEPSGAGSMGSQQVHGLPSRSHDAARVSLDTSGKATVSFGTPSLGQGLETSMAQVAADALGLVLGDVRVRWTDTDHAPISLTGSRASRAATVVGGAVARAGHAVQQQVLDVAAAMLEANVTDLVVEKGVVKVVGVPGRTLPVSEVVRRTFFDPDVLAPEHEYTFEATSRYDPPATYSNACVIVAVDIDRHTGAVVVSKIVAVEDCGRMINPMIVEGQFRGGALQAIGSALFEGVRFGPDGQPATSTLMDYLVPTMHELPEMIIDHIETYAAHNVLGLKGMGESGMIGVVSALACAVMNALGDDAPELCELPLMPASVWSALHRDER
jgi:carbon-monoxide dehydrogenase large subunit